MATLTDRFRLVTRGTACILAAFPTTVMLPVPLSLLFTKRYQREEFLKNYHFMVQWASFCRKHLLKIDLSVEGKENLPLLSRGYMYVSNHQSYVDIIVLMEASECVAFLAKDMVGKIPIIGMSAYAAGTIYLDRGDKKSRQKALSKVIRMCQESTAVIVFPEGTRSTNGELRDKIYPNAIRAAHQAGIKIVPLGIAGTHEVIPKTMDALYLDKKVSVKIGPPIDPSLCPDADLFVDDVWGQVRELFFRAKKEI